MSSKARVLIISLDGASFTALDFLVKEGYMPNLKKIMQGGFVTELESVIPPSTFPAWTSFMTGKNPGKHGIFYFFGYNRENRSIYLVNSTHIQAKTIWEIISEKGKKVVVINLPMNYPPIPVNGYLVSGFDAPSVKSDFTYPPSLKKEILELIPNYGFILTRKGDTKYCRISNKACKGFTRGIVEGFKQRTKLALYLMNKLDWDVFMVQYQNVDHLQHYLWGYVDPAFSDTFSSRSHRKCQSMVWECYQELDQCIGALIEEVPEVYKFIISDHGFGPLKEKIPINYFLARAGFLKVVSIPSSDHQKESKSKLVLKRVKGICSHIPLLLEFRRKLYVHRRLKQLNQELVCLLENVDRVTVPDIIIDWEKTTACAIGGGPNPFIYVNSPKGSRKYNEIRNSIITFFRELKHPLTSQPLFQCILKGEEIYKGWADLPDVVLIPEEGFGCDFKDVEKGEITLASGTWPLAGNHRKNGILIAQGEDVVIDREKIGAKLIDLAPTILTLLDLPVPDDMDGSVLQIFRSPLNPEFEKARPFKRSSIARSEKDEREVRERLKHLGYI